MPTKTILTFIFIIACCGKANAQIPKRNLEIYKTTAAIKIDGLLEEAEWAKASRADSFVQFQPTPFLAENSANKTDVRLMYDNDGVYLGGYIHEANKDSIAAELTGRDGFGNNDFVGVLFDTYEDRLNGYEYIITPLNEQWDAKFSPNQNGNSEDFAWNAVWQSAVKMHSDGWSFEIFIPYSAIRFGKDKIQSWGMNIFRARRKSGQKMFWQSIDPNVNGFLTQEGTLSGFENIKPPLRLQLSPYFSTYLVHDGTGSYGVKDGVSFNGGADVKYGINQAFTLDMTLIPDFGQVQTDNRTLNLSPFEQRFAENRPFFTEGTELFTKGNLFYSRRIGGEPIHYYDYSLNGSETLVENPGQSKLINATKISGRTQRGLGVGFLNAVTKPQYAIIKNDAGEKRKFETDPLTNYNVLVLDQTLKNNSSVSFVNTSVLRSGKDYDADVAALLFDLNDKSNTWNAGGNFSLSNLAYAGDITTGYYHKLYFGKTSGRFNFNIGQEFINDKYNKDDLGYSPTNNSFNHFISATYNWNTPKAWYNRIYINGEMGYKRLVKPIDYLKRKDKMFQTFDFDFNGNAQTKSLWTLDLYLHAGSWYNDFYEPRDFGRVFYNRGSKGINVNAGSNSAKKFSGNIGFFAGEGGIFHRTSFNPGIDGKIIFNSKFSVQAFINLTDERNSAGFADLRRDRLPGHTAITDTILFARRDISGVENSLLIKYSFTNRMSLNFRGRHSWTKVDPQQIYQLDEFGGLQAPTATYNGNYNKNYNFFSVDMAYNWEFARGSFLTLAWKDIGENFTNSFERSYSKNFSNIINGDQFNTLSLKVIYFLDYATLKRKMESRGR